MGPAAQTGPSAGSRQAAGAGEAAVRCGAGHRVSRRRHGSCGADWSSSSGGVAWQTVLLSNFTIWGWRLGAAMIPAWQAKYALENAKRHQRLH